MRTIMFAQNLWCDLVCAHHNQCYKQLWQFTDDSVHNICHYSAVAEEYYNFVVDLFHVLSFEELWSNEDGTNLYRIQPDVTF